MDNGAAVDVITSKHVAQEQVEPCATTLQTWNGDTVKGTEKAELETTRKNGTKHKVEFVVVKKDLTLLIGRKTAEKMGLITTDYNLVAGHAKRH